MKTKLYLSRLTSAATGILMLALCGCTIAPLKGGRATTLNKPTQRIEQTVVQSDNPAAVSKQDMETVRTKTYNVPAGSRLVETRIVTEGGAPVMNSQVLLLSAPMPVTEHEETRAKSELGAAQKDTARELSAKLASLKASCGWAWSCSCSALPPCFIRR